MSEDFVGWANDLTQGWVALQSSETSFVLSGAGAWALLAALARGAHGAAKTELEAVVGADGDKAADQLNGLFEVLSSSQGMSSAIGIWTSPQARIRPEFAKELSALTVGAIPSDLTELDVWVERATNGILTTFPGTTTPETLFIAATALAAQADWVSSFTEGDGRWRDGDDWTAWLSRASDDLSSASILRSGRAEVGRVVCETTGAFDVHLVTAAPDVSAGEVLTVGLRALSASSSVSVDDGATLEVGRSAGCLEVVDRRARNPEVALSLPTLDVTSSWDLTAEPVHFGLTTAMNPSRGHFERLADFPLAVESASQQATAGFSASGFRAAAVTEVTWMAGGGPPQRSFPVIDVHLNQPFGFLVVHRDSDLALFAGWVAEP